MIDALRKSIAMLSPRIRRRWLTLVPLAIMTGAAEMGAAAGLFALVALLTSGPAARVGLFAAVTRYLPGHGPHAIVIQLSALLAAYYVFKLLLTVWAEHMCVRISHDASAELASGMLRRYLSAPYPFHFRRNSAELIRNCTEASDEVLGGVLAAATTFVSDLLMGAGVIAVLIMTSPVPALAWGLALVFVISATLRLTRRAAGRYGSRSYGASVAILRSLQHALGGIKDVKVLGREQYFYDEFAERQRELREIGYLGLTLASVPPLAVQAVLVCGALALVAVMASTGRSGAETLPVATVFVYAGVRVLPLAQSLIVTLNGIRGRRRWVDELYEDYRALECVQTQPAAEVSFQRGITLEAVSYVYPSSDRPALENVSLTIHRGETIGIVGATGAGKSTLVDLILGLLTPSAGTIAVDGVRVPGVAHWRRRVGYVPQTLFLIDDTLRRNIALGIRDDAIDERRIMEVLRLSQLTHVLAELPQGLDTRVGEHGIRLSGGERQRVAIARAIYHDPDLVVLDEATSALDVATEAEVTRAIAALGGVKTVIVVAHRLTTVRACDRLVWLRLGRVEAIGTFDELERQDSAFRAMARLAAL